MCLAFRLRCIHRTPTFEIRRVVRRCFWLSGFEGACLRGAPGAMVPHPPGAKLNGVRDAALDVCDNEAEGAKAVVAAVAGRRAERDENAAEEGEEEKFGAELAKEEERELAPLGSPVGDWG